MKMKIRKWIKEEKGSYIVIFALFLTVLLGIISLGVDVGIMYLKKNRMYEIVQVMRDLRFTKYAESTVIHVLNGKDPARELSQEMVKYARLNGFEGEIRITYVEEHPYDESGKPADPRHYRRYRIYILLIDTYQTTTLRALNFLGRNFDTVLIRSGIAGSGHRWDGGGDSVVYRPHVPGAQSATYVSRGRGNFAVEKSATLDQYNYGKHY